MILSKKFVSDYIDLPEDIKTIAEDMTLVGNEYDYAGKLVDASKIVIGEVIECEMHPDSDRLHLTKVNVGSEVLSIVCGAPNMRKGLKVIVALDGAQLPGGIIKKSVIRGAESNGMCCSLLELGIDRKFLKDDDINGIHELPSDAPVGEDAIKYLELDDEIIDFELTSNRGDLLSMIGMAYELGAIYDREVTEPIPNYETIKDNFESDFKLNIDTEKVSLFLLGKASDVTIKESPSFIKNRLLAAGIRPINNVVDISNYIMLETGQPTHFYDADNVGNYLGVRMALENEEVKTLDGKVRKLTDKDIVICNKNEPTCLAGVMGGFDTEINDNTKNILIEAAIFDSACVRKTSKRVIRSEASNRFEKGIDQSRSYLAMDRCKELLEKYANAKISEYTHEYKINDIKLKTIEITLSKINSVLGMNLSAQDVSNVFSKLGFKVEKDADKFIVTVPSRRLDINIKEDLIEEVGRIYGVEHVEAKLPVTLIKPGNYDKYVRNIKERLSSIGLNETINYSLVSEESVNNFSLSLSDSIKVLEPMNEDRLYLRKSLVSSLLNVYDYNKVRNNRDVSIFEIGECFYTRNDEYIEEEKLAILMSGEYIYGINTKIDIDFYYIKGVVENILDFLGYSKRYEYEILNDIDLLHPYQSAYILINGEKIGFVGRMHPNIYKEDVFVAEINLTQLRNIKAGKMKFKEVSKFPFVKKDVSFIVDSNTMNSDIIKYIKRNGSKILTNVMVYDEYKMDGEKSLTYTLTFSDETRTLTEEEVMDVFNKIILNVTNKFNARIKNM